MASTLDPTITGKKYQKLLRKNNYQNRSIFFQSFYIY